MGTCEFVSQTILYQQQGDQPKVTPPVPNGPLSSQFLQSGFQVGHVNIIHCATFGFLSGACWLAPFMHTFYLLSSTWFIPLRILANSLLIDPINYTMAMIINAVAHGEGLKVGWSTVETKLYDTILTGFTVWPAAQFINFYLVPLRWRVLFFNGVSLVWNSYLAWTVGLARHQEQQQNHDRAQSSSGEITRPPEEKNMQEGLDKKAI